jgi:hypothetical protein
MTFACCRNRRVHASVRHEPGSSAAVLDGDLNALVDGADYVSS